MTIISPGGFLDCDCPFACRGASLSLCVLVSVIANSYLHLIFSGLIELPLITDGHVGNVATLFILSPPPSPPAWTEQPARRMNTIARMRHAYRPIYVAMDV